jgi:nitrite reductase/ring-hydroxylating ferredoxin subunit
VDAAAASLPPGAVLAATVEDLPPGTLLGVEVAGRRICLAHAESGIYAFQDNCTHKDFPLSAGELVDDTVECAWHGAQFDVESGRALCLPAIKPVKTYEVVVQGGQIYVVIED